MSQAESEREIRENKLHELEERLNRLEERNRRPEPPKIKGTRRQFLGVMSLGAVAALLPGVTTAQTPSETAAQQYCVMQGPVEARPEPQEGCRWVYLEGDPNQPNSQVIRFTEGEAWHLFDVVPKNLYGRGYPDHPDYGTVNDVLNDVDTAILGPNQFGDVTTATGQAIQGSGFESKLGDLTTNLDTTIFFLEVQGTTTVDNRNSLLSDWFLDNDVTITGNLNKYGLNTHLTNTVVVDGDANTLGLSSGATTLAPFNITLNGDDNVVDGNTNVSVTDNGAGNIVGDNT